MTAALHRIGQIDIQKPSTPRCPIEIEWVEFFENEMIILKSEVYVVLKNAQQSSRCKSKGGGGEVGLLGIFSATMALH